MHAQVKESTTLEPVGRDAQVPAVVPSNVAVAFPIPVSGLVWPGSTVQRATLVGAAQDPAEVEAERSAQRVIELLRARGDQPAADPEQQHSGQQHSATDGAVRIEWLRRAARVGAQGGPLDPQTAGQIDHLRLGGRPLPSKARGLMESVFDADLSEVRVHTGSQAAALNDRLAARAFTAGNDVVFAAGMPDVQQESGQRLLAHELTHVLQQRGGRDVVSALRRQNLAVEASAVDAEAVDRASSRSTVADRHGPATGSRIFTVPHDSARPIRRIMGVVAFQALTPKSFLQARKSILAIDTALSTYIESTGAARVGASNGLVLACNAYINSSGHDAARVLTVTNLRNEAIAEQPLLNALGATSADLLGDIIQRAGGAASLVQLTQLANRITGPYANLLPRLISDVGGVGGLATLDALLAAIVPIANVTQLPGLIAQAGVANLAHLAPLLQASGANVADLVFLIPRAGGGNPVTLNTLTTLLGPAVVGSALTSYVGHTEKLIPMATVANGVQATFNELALEAPHYTQIAVAPPQPGGLHSNRPRVNADPTKGAPPPPYANARYTIRWGHYYQRHVREYFRFAEIKLINTFWPAAWGNVQMAAAVNDWLDGMAAAGIYLGGPTPATDRPAPVSETHNGAGGLPANVRAGVFIQPVPPTLPALDQFFPLQGQAAVGIVDLSADKLRAIHAAVT